MCPDLHNRGGQLAIWVMPKYTRFFLGWGFPKFKKMFQRIPLYLQNCGSLPFETFTFSLDGNGIPFEAEHVAFVAGRHATNDGEAMEPYYHGQSAAVSQIIFETTVGE